MSELLAHKLDNRWFALRIWRLPASPEDHLTFFETSKFPRVSLLLAGFQVSYLAGIYDYVFLPTVQLPDEQHPYHSFLCRARLVVVHYQSFITTDVKAKPGAEFSCFSYSLFQICPLAGM